MSRSYKEPWTTDSDHLRKQKASRATRRVNKIRVTLDKDPLKAEEVVNPYDICDFKFPDSSKKGRRK